MTPPLNISPEAAFELRTRAHIDQLLASTADAIEEIDAATCQIRENTADALRQLRREMHEARATHRALTARLAALDAEEEDTDP